MQGNGAGGDHANIQMPVAAPQLPPLNAAHAHPQAAGQAADAGDAAGAGAQVNAAGALIQQGLRLAQINQAQAVAAANQQPLNNPARRDTTVSRGAMLGHCGVTTYI